MRTLLRRPSPALVIACIAVFASFGGGAFAASKLINGGKIKNGTITGKKLKKNTLGGTQINESKLAKVPSATRADSATKATTATSATTATNATNASNATNAASVGGLTLRRFFFNGTTSSAPTTVLDLRGLRLDASCQSSVNPVLTATNNSGGTAEIEAVRQDNATQSNPRSTALPAGGTFPVLDGTTYTTGIGTIQLTRQDGQGVVTVNFSFDNSPAFGQSGHCLVSGTAVG